MKKVLLLCCLIQVAWQSFAQAPCGYDKIRKLSPHNEIREDFFYDGLKTFRQQTPSLKLPETEHPSGCSTCLLADPTCFRAKYVIPIVVHVVHLPGDNTIGTRSNISAIQIQNQITQLNRAYSNFNGSGPHAVNTGIQFCLAPVGPNNDGIIRYSNTMSNHPIENFNQFLALNTTLDQDRFLHIFVCNDVISDPGVAGYSSTFGDMFQGVVAEYRTFGRYNPADTVNIKVSPSSEGDLLVHEVGHFLGLIHPFEGGCKGMNSSTCATEGDRCCDVPPVSSANTSCSNPRNSCNETPDEFDMTENYMDYAPDACKNTFTYNQTEIMHFMLRKRRTLLTDPAHINTLNLPCCTFSAYFQAGSSIVCSRDSVRFTALEYTGSTVNYNWRFLQGGTLFFTANTSTPILTLYPTNTGLYDAVLTVTMGTDVIRDTLFNAVRSYNCDTPLQSTQGNWYFGHHAGIRFMKNAVITSNRALIGFGNIATIDSDEGCITQSAKDGRLLFYGGGRVTWDGFGDAADNILGDSFYVYDKRHIQMPHGVLKGTSTSMQGGVVVPHPVNKAKYYLVTATFASTRSFFDPQVRGVRWNIIDTSLNGGNGDVMPAFKNRPIRVAPGVELVNAYDSTIVAGEGISAIPHCDGANHWLITGSGRSPSNVVHVFLTGTDTVYYHHSDTMPAPFQSLYTINASPDGNFVCISGILFRFDRVTGHLTFMRNMSFPNHEMLYSEFSPNSRILYTVPIFQDTMPLLFQTDLNSAQLNTTFIPLNPSNRVPQLGPDGKIYLAQFDQGFLSVIDNPNMINTNANPNAIGYRQDAVSLNPNATDMLARIGLPTMVDTKEQSILGSDFTYMVENCRAYTFRSTICCSHTYLWNFGDGGTSSAIFPTHTYASNGSYTVTLTTDSGTITKTVKVGMNVRTPIVAGPLTICDTSTFKNYSISNFNPDSLFYRWRAINGTLAGRNGFSNMDVKWNAAGTLRLIYTSRQGCQDSVSKTIQFATNPLVNKIYTSDSLSCTLPDTFDITGITPTGGAGSYTYLWFKKTAVAAPWLLITGQYSANLNDQPANQYYYRRVNSEGCAANSNVVIPPKVFFTSNTISAHTAPCKLGSYLKVTGTTPGVNMPSFGGSPIAYSIVWQYSADNSTWNDAYSSLSSNTGNLNAWDSTLLYDSIYIRRKISYYPASCHNYSNVIKMKYKVKVLRHPIDMTVCNLTIGGSRPLRNKVSMHNLTGSPLKFYWQYKSGSTWYSLGATNIYSDSIWASTNSMFISGSGSYQIRCQIISVCDTLYSNTATVYVKSSSLSFYISKHPQDQFGRIGSPVNFKSTGNIASCNYRWQRSSNQGTSWTTLTGEIDSVLSVKHLGQCSPNPKYFYRALVDNGCKDSTSRVAKQYDSKSEVYVRDLWTDNGVEPNPYLTQGVSFTHSPDMWISHTLDSTQPNHSYSLPNMPRVDIPINYLWTKVQNRGTDTSDQQELYLYWTLASTGEEWAKHWTNNPSNYFHKYVALPLPHVVLNPMGSQINSTPIIIPRIAPGKSIKVAYPWDSASMPKPTWYYTIVKKPLGGYDTITIANRGICFLSRIITCSTTPYGMTYPETAKLGDNVRKNNKIATNNTVLGYLNPPPGTVADRIAFLHPIIVRNLQPSGATIDLDLQTVNLDYFNYGDITATVEPALGRNWYAAGASGTGFTIIDSFKFLISTPTPFKLANIVFDPGQEFSISYDFYRKTNPAANGNKIYEFIASQKTSGQEDADGYVHFYLDAPTHLMGGMSIPVSDPSKQKDQNGAAAGSGTTTSVNAFDKVNGSLVVYPNPTSDLLTIELRSTNANEEINSISIIDLQGKVVANLKPDTAKIVFNTATLPSGIYTVKVSTDKVIYTQTVNVIH